MFACVMARLYHSCQSRYDGHGAIYGSFAQAIIGLLPIDLSEVLCFCAVGECLPRAVEVERGLPAANKKRHDCQRAGGSIHIQPS